MAAARRPGEPRDQTLGDVPYENRFSRGVVDGPSVDPDRNLVFVGTSVTPPATKFCGRIENTHLYHNSTLALDADPPRAAGYYQHLHDDWDLDHPSGACSSTPRSPATPDAVAWINPACSRARTGG